MQYFSALVKPASSLCNMRCAYCFYHDVAENRETASYGVMKEETARRLVEEIAAFVKSPAQVSFLFQGGEPTLAGLAFFERFAALCQEILPTGLKVRFSIQTNGLLLDDAWCAFLKEHQVLVGLSWDGPAELHDGNRVDAGGKGTFSRVKRAASLLEAWGVEYNVLCVVTKASARHGEKLLRFFLRQGVRHLQFIPCLEPLGAEGERPYTLSPRQYGSFLTGAFSFWVEEQKRGKELHIRTFENLFQLLRGQPAEQCGAMGFCTAQFVVEGDGSVYPCDFYVLDDYYCGNVRTDSIEKIRSSPGLRAFMERCEPKPAECESCPVVSLCGGGCARYRSFYGRETGYCPHQAFLLHALKTLRGEEK